MNIITIIVEPDYSVLTEEIESFIIEVYYY